MAKKFWNLKKMSIIKLKVVYIKLEFKINKG